MKNKAKLKQRNQNEISAFLCIFSVFSAKSGRIQCVALYKSSTFPARNSVFSTFSLHWRVLCDPPLTYYAPEIKCPSPLSLLWVVMLSTYRCRFPFKSSISYCSILSASFLSFGVLVLPSCSFRRIGGRVCVCCRLLTVCVCVYVYIIPDQIGRAVSFL